MAEHIYTSDDGAHATRFVIDADGARAEIEPVEPGQALRYATLVVDDDVEPPPVLLLYARRGDLSERLIFTLAEG